VTKLLLLLEEKPELSVELGEEEDWDEEEEEGL
jgi:hypothetical protein